MANIYFLNNVVQCSIFMKFTELWFSHCDIFIKWFQYNVVHVLVLWYNLFIDSPLPWEWWLDDWGVISPALSDVWGDIYSWDGLRWSCVWGDIDIHDDRLEVVWCLRNHGNGQCVGCLRKHNKTQWFLGVSVSYDFTCVRGDIWDLEIHDFDSTCRPTLWTETLK